MKLSDPTVRAIHCITRRVACIVVCGFTCAAFGQINATSPVRIVPGLEEPLVATAATSQDEVAALNLALSAYQARPTASEDFRESAKPLVAFLEANPASAWRMALLTNLGLGYYRAGYFTKASAAWEQAWTAGQGSDRPEAAALADRAFGELARMQARVGHADELQALLTSLGERKVSGPATEMVTGSKEALWSFRNDWEHAYLCGPKALKNLLVSLNASPATTLALDKVRSGPHGFTLAQVSSLADDAGLTHKLVYRAPGQPVPVPSIINWRLNHYAAILGLEHGKYRIQDPTFGSGDLFVTAAAIDEESSGYFLVPEVTATALAWRTVTAEEAQRIFGMGFTANSQPGATTPDDTDMHPPQCPRGMCVANAKSMLVSLNLSDVPLGYLPAKGPSIPIRLTYNQREAYQPAVFGFFNIGPKWTLSVLAWIEDNPTAPGSSVIRHVAGGGAIDYAAAGYGYEPSNGNFSAERQGQYVLVRIPATGPVNSYELRMPDGSKQVYGRSDGATSTPRRMFLTQFVDAFGNTATLNYDESLRVRSITDATGRRTLFAYGVAAKPLLVSRITDPFGRSASLTYDNGGRLASITDVLGLTSSFSYDAGGLVNAMTTPYGTSRFVYGEVAADNSRFLEVTDPLGYTERLEFRHTAPGIAFGDPVETVPSGFLNGDQYLYYRNTFHWDKHLYPITHTDYTRARTTHWLHNVALQTGPIIESIKEPLERRVWMSYASQTLAPWVEGTSDKPIATARVLDDGSTQTTALTYNGLGKPLTAIDPLGRKIVNTYAANSIDLLTVQQQTTAGGMLSTIASFTYNAQHLPLTATDAAGQATRYGYNSAGQVTSVTNALNQSTNYSYDGFGRLLSIVDATGTTQRSYTYDAFDRVATTTDSLGYGTSTSYDAFDRTTRIAYPDGTTKETSYDKLDTFATKDRLNQVTTYSHDAARRLVSMTDPLGLTTRYGYYENGTLSSLTDPKGNITRWDVDIQSRPIAKRYANGNVETYAYEATTSRLKTSTDPLGQIKGYRYAKDDRVTAFTYTNAIRPTANVAFSYDAFFPRVTAMVDGVGTTQFQYQPIGSAGALQPSLEDGPYANDSITYQYDALGRITARGVDSTSEIYTYDTIGRLIGHASALGNFTRSYLGQTGQLTSQVSASGVGTRWLYDGNINDRRLVGVANSGLARSFGLTTSPESRITNITESIAGSVQRSLSYDYDADDRLTSAAPSTGTPYTYTYDGAGNLSSINGTDVTYNTANQVANLGRTSYAYDSNGNLIDDGLRTYQWDAENRLVTIAIKAQPGQATNLRYDGMGRRLAIVDYGSSGSTETRYLWCADKICQARTNNDVVIRRYFDEGAFTPPSGQSVYYAVDQIGSVRDVLTIQNGAKVGSYDYDPYGNTAGSSSRVSTDFRYAAMFYHAQSGLYLTNFRAYDPRLAKWLSRDPIREVGGVNLYTYVGENPLSRTDPSGLCPFCVLALPFIAGGTGITLADVGIGAALGGLAIGIDRMFSNSDRPPPGSVPISGSPWSGDHGGIKDALGLGGRDSVFIDPEGNIWVQHPDGSWSNEGPASDYTGSGKASGRRGKDRDKKDCP